jgi:phosphoglycolate phosphatase
MAIGVDCRQDWDKLLSGVDTVIFDCDGVLWLGDNECIPGAQDLVRTLKQNGKNVCFVTNNSSKSRRQYLEKFTKLKFDSVKAEDIHSPASVAGVFLKDILKIEGKVYLLGMEGFGEELDLMGLEYFGPGLDPFTGSLEEWSKYEYDPKPPTWMHSCPPEVTVHQLFQAQDHLCLLCLMCSRRSQTTSLANLTSPCLMQSRK